MTMSDDLVGRLRNREGFVLEGPRRLMMACEEAANTIEAKDALLITYRAEIVRFSDQTATLRASELRRIEETDRVLTANANLRGDLEEAEAGKDRLEEECARLRSELAAVACRGDTDNCVMDESPEVPCDEKNCRYVKMQAANASLRAELEHCKSHVDALDRDGRADQTKYHHNLTEIAQQHVKDLDRLRSDKDELWAAIRERDEKINNLVKDLSASERARTASERARVIAVVDTRELSDAIHGHVNDLDRLRAELASCRGECDVNVRHWLERGDEIVRLRAELDECTCVQCVVRIKELTDDLAATRQDAEMANSLAQKNWQFHLEAVIERDAARQENERLSERIAGKKALEDDTV